MERTPRPSGLFVGDLGALSTVLVAALAFGAAGFGFGSYFYLVPYHRKAAQVERLSKELRAKNEAAARRRTEVQGQDAAARLQSHMKSLQAQIEARLSGAGASVILGADRMLVRFPEDKVFDARGPWLTRPGQEAVQTLGEVLGARAHRVVIAAPMGTATVPRWVRGTHPTPGDLSAARAGNALKSIVKGGIRADSVIAVIGTLATVEPALAATLDFEIEL